MQLNPPKKAKKQQRNFRLSAEVIAILDQQENQTETVEKAVLAYAKAEKQ